MQYAGRSEFMKTCLRYGLGIGVAWFIGNLTQLLLVFQGERIDLARIVFLVQSAVAGICLALGIRAIRMQSVENSLRFGRGFGAGMLITVFWGLGSTALDLVYTTFLLKEDQVDTILSLNFQRDALAGKIPTDQLDAGLDAAMRFVNISLHPILRGGMAILEPVLWGVLPSLVLAAVLRRKPAASAQRD